MHRTQVIVADELDGADGVRYMADNAWCIIDNNPEAADAWTRMFLYSQKPGQHPPGAHGKTVPSIHMPRWASRLTLSVTDARLQRLPEITDTDAIAEGLRLAEQQPGYFEVADLIGMDPVAVFATLWDSLHDIPGERWCDAPEVVALTFRVSLCNIDQTKE